MAGCVLGSGWGGGSLKAPTQRSERSTHLPQAHRLLTTYKRLVPNPNTATPLLVFHGAHMRGLGASGAVMVIPFEQKEPDYLLWGCFRWGFASASTSTPAGCLLQSN